MWKVLSSLLKLLAPVGIRDNAEAQQAWRWAIFVTIVLIVATICIGVLYANGKIMGSTGYVQRADLLPMTVTLSSKAAATDLIVVTNTLAKVSSSVDFLTRESIEAAIRAKLSTACMTEDKAFRSELNQEVQDLEDKYFRLTGTGYRQPTCEEL